MGHMYTYSGEKNDVNDHMRRAKVVSNTYSSVGVGHPMVAIGFSWQGDIRPVEPCWKSVSRWAVDSRTCQHMEVYARPIPPSQ